MQSEPNPAQERYCARQMSICRALDAGVAVPERIIIRMFVSGGLETAIRITSSA